MTRRLLALLPLLALALGAFPPVAAPQSDPLAARAKGRADAPVVVYEMADFQCPACRQFALETMPAIEREYVRTGKVRFVFINFPLSVFDSTFHRNAGPAAELAMCAARQDRFWPAHDALFQRQSVWAPLADPAPYFAALADTIGLDRRALAGCQRQRCVVRGDQGDTAPVALVVAGIEVALPRGFVDSLQGVQQRRQRERQRQARTDRQWRHRH